VVSGDHCHPPEVVVSDLRRKAVTLLRAEFADEAASDFPRLRRIPQTDIIWFLDYFVGLSAADREALLDALADSAAMAFPPLVPVVPQFASALAQMIEARNRPGGKGGTRYTDLKQLSALPSLREPGGYHESWRENFTPQHFQPRPDLLPDLGHLKPAKSPLVRKLVNKDFSEPPWAMKKETQAGGVSKFVAPFGDGELTIRVRSGRCSTKWSTTSLSRTPGGGRCSRCSATNDCGSRRDVGIT
jgi:hypothetical protein